MSRTEAEQEGCGGDFWSADDPLDAEFRALERMVKSRIEAAVKRARDLTIFLERMGDEGVPPAVMENARREYAAAISTLEAEMKWWRECNGATSQQSATRGGEG